MSGNCELDNKLELIPLAMKDGKEVVIIDDEIVKEGCEKWKNTLCGHFVGYRMPYAEIRYNLRRMWGKFGLVDIVSQGERYLFKFKDDTGMDQILESGPWMVNNKPLFVKKMGQ